MKPKFFAYPPKFRAWLKKHHASETELWVGFYKKATGKPSITWPEAVDEALCFGWIDGVRRSLDDEAYSIRFTPRRKTSNWSAVNIARMAELEKQGKLTPAGERAFEARSKQRSRVYSFERDTKAKLSATDERRLRANARAADFFDAQAPWYQRAAIHWVISAKRSETKQRRLDQLIASSAARRTIPPLTRPGSGAATKTARKK
jgi:uncharacterized protein YdeI (YjbR/CyaY-like superfamily)